VTPSFLDNFSDMLERLSTFSVPQMIAGDFNTRLTLVSCNRRRIGRAIYIPAAAVLATIRQRHSKVMTTGETVIEV